MDIKKNKIVLLPHCKTSPEHIKKSFSKARLYSDKFLKDLEDGLKKSKVYEKIRKPS